MSLFTLLTKKNRHHQEKEILQQKIRTASELRGIKLRQERVERRLLILQRMVDVQTRMSE